MTESELAEASKLHRIISEIYTARIAVSMNGSSYKKAQLTLLLGGWQGDAPAVELPWEWHEKILDALEEGHRLRLKELGVEG